MDNKTLNAFWSTDLKQPNYKKICLDARVPSSTYIDKERISINKKDTLYVKIMRSLRRGKCKVRLFKNTP
jgi:hypothetical protein